MRVWGRNEGLKFDEVLNAVGNSLFKRINDENRVRFCVYQDDHKGDAIFLRVPSAKLL